MDARKIRALFVASVLLLVGVSDGTQTEAKTKGKLDANALSMDVVGGYFILVRASIGDRHDLNFRLAPGAPTSAIDRKPAERRGWATRASQMVNFDKTLR